jgi:hypothetical protein
MPPTIERTREWALAKIDLNRTPRRTVVRASPPPGDRSWSGSPPRTSTRSGPVDIVPPTPCQCRFHPQSKPTHRWSQCDRDARIAAMNADPKRPVIGSCEGANDGMQFTHSRHAKSASAPRRLANSHGSIPNRFFTALLAGPSAVSNGRWISFSELPLMPIRVGGCHIAGSIQSLHLLCRQVPANGSQILF